MRKKGYPLIDTKLLDGSIDYTGAELRSHFVRETAGIRSDGVVAFVGACNVSGERIVDLDDAEKGNTIEARSMLHFIGEHFQCSLREGNLRLRLFTSIVKEVLEEETGKYAVRRGDDLFIDDRKLSVAIASTGPASVLFHFGVNVDPSGAPVPAIGLNELGVGVERFALSVLERYVIEHEQIEWSLRKVKGVP